MLTKLCKYLKNIWLFAKTWNIDAWPGSGQHKRPPIMNESHPCVLCWPNKKSKYFPAIGFLHKLVCVVSETTGWADGCHIRWPGWGVSVILLRCPSDILLGGPTFCATDACTKSYMKSYTRNIFSSPSSSSWYPPWGVQHPVPQIPVPNPIWNPIPEIHFYPHLLSPWVASIIYHKYIFSVSSSYLEMQH